MAASGEFGPMMAKVAVACGGDISASQEDILAKSPFLGAGNGNDPAGNDQYEEEEVFSTPPELSQQEPITMCTLPFTPSPTPTPSKPHSPPPSHAAAPAAANPPRVPTTKVRGAKIRTPTPSPKKQPQPEEPPHAVVDPLYRAVLMIPSATATSAAAGGKQDPLEDFLALARQRGIF